MRAIYLAAPRQFEIKEQPTRPLVGAREVRLRMQSVGVCGSDMHYYRSGRIGVQILTEPWVLGHECTAVVTELGTEVSALQLGDRVAVDPLIHCGSCSQCTVGREHTCLEQQFLGCPGQLPGSMMEELVMPAACCLPISNQLSDAAAVMAEPLAIALHAVEQLKAVSHAPLQQLDTVVLGAGPVGLCVLAACLQQEARCVYTTDPLKYRQQMASSLGASGSFSPDNAASELRSLLPEGADCVFECAGEPEALAQAIDLLKPGGVLVIVGIPEGNSIQLDINQIRRKEITIQNVRRQNGCAERAVHLLENKLICLDSVVTHHFAMERSTEAFELVAGFEDGVGKVLVEFGPDRAKRERGVNTPGSVGTPAAESQPV